MKLELIILGLLSQNPCTGYDIKKYLDTEGRFGWPTRPLSQIYTTLKRMAEKGWVVFEVQPRDGKPDLKMYTFTEEGLAYFLEYLNSPLKLAFRYRESEISLRIIYAYLLEPEVILDHLKTEVEYRKEQIAKYRNRDRSISSHQISQEQVNVANKIYEKLHQVGAKGIDDYVLMLEDLADYFRKSMKN